MSEEDRPGHSMSKDETPGESVSDGERADRRASVTCRVGRKRFRGVAIDLAAAVDSGALVAAIRGSGGEPVADAEGPAITVECPEPGPLFDHVGHLHPEMGLRTKTALARAGRSRGMETPYDDELAAARDRLAALGTPDREREARRTTVEDHEQAVAALREQVAAARGQLQARREAGGDTDQAAADLREAIRELTEHETAAIAARQELAATDAGARKRRDRHEQRFELEDRIANLERDARAWLVEQLGDAYAEALDALPEATTPERPSADLFAADPVSGALAVARVGEPAAPIVLDCDRFDSAAAAHDWLGCPVIRL